MNSLTVNVNTGKYELKEINLFSILDYTISEHLKNKTYKVDPLGKKNSLIISSGPFTGLGIPGAHRAIISGRSPLTKGFFFSTVGGLGEELYRTSVDSIKITGRAKKPSILLIRYEDNKLFVRVEEIPQLFKIYEENGVYSLQEWLVNNYISFFKDLRYRSIVVGPAGFNTILGGLSSVVVKNDQLDYGSEGFAGRGGYGSVMAQGHNIAGVMIGGDYKKELRPKVKNVIVNFFNNPNLFETILDNTEKYKVKGTLLSNFEVSENDALMFNWDNMYWSKKKRLKYYDKLIRNSYLKDYLNKEVTSKTCGENCPALCKKVQEVHVKSYEPYSSCGPNLGIFTQEAAEKLVNLVNAMGFDAISFGNLLSTVFEALNKGLIEPEELRLDEKPVFTPEKFKLSDSMKNARIAIKLAKLMCNEQTILDDGVRSFSEKKNVDLGVFFCFGSRGVISPNEYLRPGFITPLPILGKFTTFYGKQFIEPLEQGKRSAERFIKELYNEDTGFCRFHRRWAEKVIPLMVNELVGYDKNTIFDYDEHIKGVINKIIKYNQLSDSLPQKWSSKTKDLLYHHLLISIDAFGESKITAKWINKFKQDPKKALDDYWSDLVRGVSEVLGGEYRNAMD